MSYSFELGDACKDNDKGCWRTEFKKRFRCKDGDYECWRKQIPLLPCEMNNLECWKRINPKAPCPNDDEECWKGLWPYLPCKLNDEKCWNNINGKKSFLFGYIDEYALDRAYVFDLPFE